MSSRNESNSRFVAIVSTLVLVAVAASFIGGCAQRSTETTKTTTKATTETNDADVHVKVDLPDTVTIK